MVQCTSNSISIKRLSMYILHTSLLFTMEKLTIFKVSEFDFLKGFSFYYRLHYLKCWSTMIMFSKTCYTPNPLCKIFTILLTFLGKSAHMLNASGVYNSGIWSQGLILHSGRSYATFGTKIPFFRANSECLLGTKWQKWWIYKNVSRIMKIVHSAIAIRKIYFCHSLASLPTTT